MTLVSVKISGKHRVAVPAAIRKELNLKAGDHLLARVHDGVIVLVPRRGDAVDQLRGLYREIWQDEDVDAYLDREQEGWDRDERSMLATRQEEDVLLIDDFA